jgi:hypothetical protein
VITGHSVGFADACSNKGRRLGDAKTFETWHHLTLLSTSSPVAVSAVEDQNELGLDKPRSRSARRKYRRGVLLN